MRLRSDFVTTSYQGLLFDVLEEYLEFIEALTEYLEIHPGIAAVYNNRGMAYAEIGEYQKALEDFTKAVECDPLNPIHFLNRARHYEILNKPEWAADDYLAAKRLQETGTSKS
jgi:tetratricopeptide (TPR) repeat protein